MSFSPIETSTPFKESGNTSEPYDVFQRRSALWAPRKPRMSRLSKQLFRDKTSDINDTTDYKRRSKPRRALKRQFANGVYGKKSFIITENERLLQKIQIHAKYIDAIVNELINKDSDTEIECEEEFNSVSDEYNSDNSIIDSETEEGYAPLLQREGAFNYGPDSCDSDND